MVLGWKAASRKGVGQMNSRNVQKPKAVVFLGAGASCAEGAPSQSKLFREYFTYYNSPWNQRGLRHRWDEELAIFFKTFFGINVDDMESIKLASFPTFEEVLGIIEIADSQNESFKGWDTSEHVLRSIGYQKPPLKHMHDILILLIAEILDHKLGGRAEHHPRLIQSLHDADWLHTTSFISLNYDILLDNALLKADEDFGLDLDYAIDFINFGNEWRQPDKKKNIKLFKLHGSLNWLYCPTCRTIRITPKEKGVCHLKWKREDCTCSKCDTLAVPIVIPPTYFKALSNLYLRQIWHTAEQALMECDRLIFCGYSFPDADLHIRYLLKRVEMNRQSSPEVYIVNEHKGKDKTARQTEQDRHLRFFLEKHKVHWTRLSFEEFCMNPTSIEDSSKWEKLA
ncbi:MAG TPA: hypothetical protein ENN79_03735 [Desulfobacteraceae bacterium]|mgnify:CR=1 FL=1|nr:hypothetical protein [Desulfobacteraceae bacterium]